MNPADLLVAAVIFLIVGTAIVTVYRNLRAGGRCSYCKECCNRPKVIEIEDAPKDSD